jgi:hypothetical protein
MLNIQNFQENATPTVRILRFIRWDRRSGNALAFADVEVILPDGTTRIYKDLKLCQNGKDKPFVSEPQEGYVGRKLYRITSFSVRRAIERALVHAYNNKAKRERARQLALALGVAP